jgi:predicted phosphodiesterase
MPKYAILSDIHANSDALKVVLEKCRELAVDKYVSIGDIVGYNAEPELCMKLTRDLDFCAMVRGNHDDYVASGNTEMSGFNANAKKAITWTREQLDASERSYLGSIPYQATMPACGTTLVHATLDTPENWGYIFGVHDAAGCFTYQKSRYCFCGHSHVPVAFDMLPISGVLGRGIEVINEWVSNRAHPENDTDFSVADSLSVQCKIGHKYLFNIGSIGQPRNGDPRASFAVLDTGKNIVTRYRLPYDVASAQQKIVDAGLPERLAVRLAAGM